MLIVDDTDAMHVGQKEQSSASLMAWPGSMVKIDNHYGEQKETCFVRRACRS